MKKRLIRLVSLTTAVMSFCTSAAFAADGKVVLTGVSAAKIIVDSSVEETAPNWQAIGEGNGFETNVGRNIYKNTIADNALYWDFEDESEIGGNGELHRWVSASANRPGVLTDLDDVETYNVTFAQDYPDSYASKPEEGENTPAESSTKCLRIENDPIKNQWIQHLTANVKIQKSDVTLGVPYKLSLYAMDNSVGRGIFASVRPSTNNVNETYGDYETIPWVNDKSLFDKDNDWAPLVTQDWKISKLWKKCEKELTFTAEDFNSDGLATLWLVAVNDPMYNSSGEYQYMYPYEKMYYDNITLEPVESEPQISSFNLDCEVQGAPNQNISVQLMFDGRTKLAEIKGVCGEDGKADIRGNIELSSDADFIKGKNRLTTSQDSDERIKLSITSDSDDEFEIKSIAISKNVNNFSARPVAVNFEIYSEEGGTVTIKDAKTDGTEFTIETEPGLNVYRHNFDSADRSSMMFNVYDAGGRDIAGRIYHYDKFFKNGVPFDYESEGMVKAMGPGRYLLEFDVYDNVEGDLTLNWCGAETTVKLTGMGLYKAEFDVTDENLKGEVNTELISNMPELPLYGIEMRKTMDTL